MAAMKRTHSGTTKVPSHDSKTTDNDPSHDSKTMDLEIKEIPKPGTGADDYFHNLYRSEINFRQLARQDAAFAALYVESHGLSLDDTRLTMDPDSSRDTSISVTPRRSSSSQRRC